MHEVAEARRLLEEITPGDWFAADWPSQGWTVCWKQDAPICHMRWTDGLRPEVEARIEAEAKFIAAAPRLIRDLIAALTAARQELDAVRQAVTDAEQPSGDTGDILDLVGVFIDHHKATEQELTAARHAQGVACGRRSPSPGGRPVSRKE